MRIVDHEIYLDVNELTVKENNIFKLLSDYNTVYTDAGRASIRLLSEMLPGGEIIVPAYSCSSIFRSFDDRMKISYYKVNSAFCAIVEDIEARITPETVAILVTNAFGKIQPEPILKRIRELADEHGLIIIEDTTHSIFSNVQSIGDYCICSLRKWFPVPDGGVIYSKLPLDKIDVKNLKQGGIADRIFPLALTNLYKSGRISDRNLYEEMYAEAESKLDVDGYMGNAYAMSDLSRFLYSCYDVYEMAEKRKANHSFMRFLLKDVPYVVPAIPDFPKTDCPFDLPVYVDKDIRDELRDFLRDNQIFPWRLWRIYENHELNDYTEEINMARCILNLPVDQYQTFEDMQYVADKIKEFHFDAR